MSRLFGLTCVLLALALSAPYLARLAQQAVPTLIALLILLGVVRLVWPSRRRR